MIGPVMSLDENQSVLTVSRRASLLLGMGAILSACNVIPDVNKPLNLYSLSPKMAPVTHSSALAGQLVIAEPKAGADLATNRIALTRAANRIEYFAEGVWSDAAPALVQSKLIQAFEETVPQLAVGRDSAGLKPDYILQSELRHLEASYFGSTGEAVIQITAKLVKMPERKIIKSISAAARQASGGSGLPSMISAFEAALATVFNQLVTGVVTAWPS